MAKKRIVALTVFLIKRNLNEADCIDAETDRPARTLNVVLDRWVVGKLHVKQTPTSPPKWAAFFGGAIDVGAHPLRSTSVSAVYLTRVSGRLFALTFGHGRHLLRPGIHECQRQVNSRVDWSGRTSRFYPSVFFG
jgi:uncharacterized protein (TIGR04141 family)